MGNTMLQKSSEWTGLWARWIRRTAETAAEVLADAKAWSARWGEPLPRVMR